MASRVFPIGTPLTVVWHFSKPDGTTFDLSGYTYRVYYRTGNRQTEVNSSHLTASGNMLTVVIPADMQYAPGEYSLKLVLYQNSSIFCTLVYNVAFVLSQQMSGDPTTETQSEGGNTVHLYTVAEFYMFSPVVPTVGNDGYWYVNGNKISDGNGEFIPSSHTVEYDPATNRIIIDRGRVNQQGQSIAQVITSLADALGIASQSHNTAEQDHARAETDHDNAGDDHTNAQSDHEAIQQLIEQYEPIVINGNVTNAPDEEDITSDTNDLLKFKDRGTIYGMGYVILRKDKTFAEQLTKTNTIYEIRYDFDLDDETITLPEGSILNFVGGSVSNGVLIGSKCSFNHATYQIFDNVVIKDFNIPYLDIRWFGAKVMEDASQAFRDALACLEFNPYIYISVVGTYYINSSIDVTRDLRIKGSTFRVTEIGRAEDEGSTKSALIVADGVTAFNIIGREPTVSGHNFAYCQFEFDHVYMKGQGSRTATAIKISASGAPGRLSSIDHCEFINFKYALHAKEDTGRASIISGLRITNTYFNSDAKAIYVENVEAGIDDLHLVNSFVEYCGDEAIDVTIFGTFVIDQCVIESILAPIKIKANTKGWDSAVTIANTYFETVTSVEKPYAITIGGDFNVTASIENCTGLQSVHLHRVRLNNQKLIGGNSLYDQCYFLRCSTERLLFGNIGIACLFADCDIEGKADTFNTNITYTDYQNGNLYGKVNNVYMQKAGDYTAETPIPIMMDLMVDTVDGYYLDIDAMTSNWGEKHYGFTNVGVRNIVLGNIYLSGSSNNAMCNLIYRSNSTSATKPVYCRNRAFLDSPSSSDRLADFVAREEAFTIGATRPTLSNTIRGYQYFDTTLGKPIWWNGTEWVDATGTAVS